MNLITPSGRYMGRKPDVPNSSDRRYRFAHHHEMLAPIAPSIDLVERFPAFLPPLDQGKAGACGPNSAARWLKQYYPKLDLSRLDLYWQVRLMEGSTAEDSGVQTRDLFAVMEQVGVRPESEWPYDIDKLLVEPPPSTTPRTKITGYARIASAAELLACLSAKRSAIMGFEVPASFDDPEIASKGVLRYPQIAEPTIGGHDTHIVGFDTNFKESAIFKASGVDPALMSDHAIKVENSWGDWGLGGFFWMALAWAVDVSTGADLWSGTA